MMNHNRAFRVGGLGAVALAFALSGCAGSSNALAPATNAGPNGVAQLSVVSDHHHKLCAPTTNTINFNNTTIPANSWIWFVSVVQSPHQSLALEMKSSKIVYTVGSTRYTIKGPQMLLKAGGLKLHLGAGNKWLLRTPSNTGGNDFLNGIAYQTPVEIPANNKNVTWSAKFYSHSQIKDDIHWMWGAAVYTSFSKKGGDLGVKPLDDQKYPPYNNDKAGTPENFKAYLTTGGTGNGHDDYTGNPGHGVDILPCI